MQFCSTFTDQKRWVVGTYAPHRNARGEIIGVIATLRDITERKRTEESLRDSENKFASIIEFLPDATFVIDLEGKVVAWNRAMEEMTGVKKDDMIGRGDHAYTVPFYGERRKQLLDLLDKDDKEIASKYQYVQRKGDTLYAETFAHALQGGKGAYVWATGKPILDVHGNRAGAIESIRDITERKRAEDVLQEAKQAAEDSKTQYKQVVSMISDIIWRYDVNAQGENIGSYISSVADRLLGLPDGTIGNSFEKYFTYIYPDDLPSVRDVLSNGIRTLARDLTTEYRLQKADGTTIWVQSKGSAYSHSDGRVTAFGTTTDITDRKRAEEELRWNAALLDAQVESSLDGILVVDEQGTRIITNNRLLTMWKVPQSIIGQKNDDALLKYVVGLVKNPDQFVEKVKYLYRHQNETSRDEIEFEDGLVMDRYSSPVIGRDGKYYGRIWTFRDITEHKRAEDALRESEQRLTDIIDFLPDATFAVNREGKVIAWNRAIEEMTGISKDDILGRGCKSWKNATGIKWSRHKFS